MGKKKKPFDYKTTIWVGLALVALMIVVMAILIFNQNEKIDSSYFKDGDNKIAITLSKEMSALDDSEYESDVVHMVYFYDGEKITRARAFFEYATDAEARESYDHIDSSEFADARKLNGRFIIYEIKKEKYENTSVSDLRESIELLKQIDALILDYGEGYVKPRANN